MASGFVFLLVVLVPPVLSSGHDHCFGNAELSDCSEDCQPLKEVLQNDSVVNFCPGVILLKTHIVLHRLSNITLIGNKTTLNCIRKGIGMEFVHVTGLTIKNLTITRCGSVHDSTTHANNTNTVPFMSALYSINSSNLYLEDVCILSSRGIGLALFDTNGTVEVLNSIFKSNKPFRNGIKEFVGGGVYVEFTLCAPRMLCENFHNKKQNPRSNGNHYTFHNCTFRGNNATYLGPKYAKYRRNTTRLTHQGLGRGGGLSVHINGKSANNTFTVENCMFEQNKANWGGGLYMVMQDSSSNNVVRLSRLTVYNNTCKRYGGGGVNLGFNVATTRNNSVVFEDCQFIKNRAKYGGGVRVYSSRRNESMFPNNLRFSNCEWINNSAIFGSAVDIAPHVWEVLSSGFLPEPEFHNCKFKSNSAGILKLSESESIPAGFMIYTTSRGALMLTKFTVFFSGTITFDNNTGSAVYLSSSTIETISNTMCRFTRNNGFEGGAIALFGFSALFVQENSSFHFTNNTATRRGGALYAYNIDKHNFVSSRSCFIQYIGSELKEKNVSFIFEDNFAGNRHENSSKCVASGHSIFSPSLLTCIHACDQGAELHSTCDLHHDCVPSPSNTFKCVGTFTFSGTSMDCQVSTSGGKFQINESVAEYYNLESHQLKFFPGRDMKLPFSLLNDYNKTVEAVYYATIADIGGSNIKINHAYTYISNRQMLLHAMPNATGVLRLQKLGVQPLVLDINVRTMECPPGYILDDTATNSNNQINEKCVCSASNPKYSFKPITHCDNKQFAALLNKGYWIGYHNVTLEYGYCPTGYCHNLKNVTSYLPKERHLVDKTVCGKYRMGTLCGQCTANYSVYYHSINYKCASNDSCNYGWLLYIVSELLPLTVLFVLATVFNVSFTSGAVNGFIWYAQMVNSFPITGKSFIIFPDPVYHMISVTRMIYNIFNFNFFSHDRLSFCLWQGATTMDMLIFKFVTVLYAIFLVVITVCLIKYCNIFKRCRCLRFSTIKTSIIHGLSSVLVIVFSQCFKVCSRIFEWAYLFGEGNEYHHTVVYLQGNLTPFEGDHIKYALFAIICTLVMLVPMLFLLVFPINFKVLNILKCSDTNKFARAFCHIPFQKLKPFLDSFQSCFKDNCRVFAGLYFVYRGFIISATLFARLSQQYDALSSVLTTILLIHALAQPYRERWHNIVDGLLFFNLIVINKISRYNYYYTKFPDVSIPNPIPFTSSLQLIILNIPLFCMITYLVTKIICKIWAIKKRRVQGDLEGWNNLNDFELPNRDEESDSEDDSTNYRAYVPKPPLNLQPYYP